MSISKSIHFFSSNEAVNKKLDKQLLGIRGRQANEFAELRLPILPGIIIDASVAYDLENEKIIPVLKPFLEKFATISKKAYADETNPMLLKIVVSPNLVIANYPTLHNFGLTKNTFAGFAGKVGDNFASHEVYFLLRGMLQILLKNAELEENKKAFDLIDPALKEIDESLQKNSLSLDGIAIMEKYQNLLPEGFFDDAYIQLEQVLKQISKLLSLEDDSEGEVALVIQPMAYGNYGKESYSGRFFSRNIVTGEKKLQGLFYEEKFDDRDSAGKDINSIKPAYLKQLQDIAWSLEDHSKEIREVRFTIEAGNLWLIEQRSVEAKSTISLVLLLLDLYNRKIVDSEYVVKTVKPGQLNEILHPVIDIASVKNLKSSHGGIAGAPGAAVGRVYFSADSLIDAQRIAKLEGSDTRCILCMPATYAGDVKAIEVATGVLSNEGGYAAHASVVARQYGKISLVRSDMKIQAKKAIIDGITINEGDFITLNVPYYGESTVYFGAAQLIEPDPETSGLLDFIALAKSFMQDFYVRANADSPHDAELALAFGAEGIGLCRTEHMFFKESRINIFREMILCEDSEKRAKVLKQLQKLQTEDFYGILKIMAGKDVTIRLLDAPLHEFLPYNDQDLDVFIEYLSKKTKEKVSKKQLRDQMTMLSEINPMLGHRGCRIAISYPEIYAMQIRAIFEAAYKLQKEKITVYPEIMIPLIMNSRELKQIIYGKKIEGHSYLGISALEEEIRAELKAKTIPYKVGTMIELPAAALSADEIARYAEFFSFGTNDLSQTTLGLSRDDFNSFMPDYTMYDLIDGNPFAVLDTRVRELIEIAIRRGKLSRPDIHLGLCGEHGARAENIRFCMDAGLDYVSCSSYSVPIALLSIAQAEIENAEKAGIKLTPKRVVLSDNAAAKKKPAKKAPAKKKN
ncbi:pyruvate, phosphate dikinase [Treponema phagedenis]|uniref:Pyruvate, phosphate dikinase n=1 Tax=Treponema phagedenis TaxID=162 RepID=A0A0B7GUG4_TREPH|nr:putative PEP-binding protein [Treponema phagedenis]QEK01138.1 pyruvate, phosphate dikinase [Treponema phagedenis]QSH99195.1 pyruvate, phosphate dikinase [Treponema phagedenis]TYT76471.1 pyruvate, phosphate dikinase [Treponema phagedenis]TYT79816.1 pyruvate, phosphate dikinase [Treponema phagedenis]CEM62128.1 Pyruvate, phosphate dikinase [Treponema phagedenis]